MEKTILIVDDSPTIIEKLLQILKSENFDVLTASNGEEAIQYFCTQSVHIDAVITDVHMPHVDGMELIQIIRTYPDFKNVPILILTSENQSEIKLKAKNLGATGWIQKPFVATKVIEAVKKVLR